MLTPLRTLTNSLVFSGRNEEVGGESREYTSIFLNNTALLYKGIDVSLNGGVTSSTETDGTKMDSTMVTLGANIVPHRTATVTLYLTDSRTDQTGPGRESLSIDYRRLDLTVAYNPFRTLYIVGSLQLIEESGQGMKTFQSYGLNWSPFPDGALQFRFSYNETRRPEDQLTDRILTPGLRYKINNRSFLDLSYQWTRSESASQTIDSSAFTSNLKIFL